MTQVVVLTGMLQHVFGGNEGMEGGGCVYGHAFQAPTESLTVQMLASFRFQLHGVTFSVRGSESHRFDSGLIYLAPIKQDVGFGIQDLPSGVEIAPQTYSSSSDLCCTCDHQIVHKCGSF